MTSNNSNIVLKQIGPIGGISIVAGSIIGSGIFIAPSLVAAFTSSIPLVTVLWLAGALLCFIGADIYGKLGALYPAGGGQYVYLKNCVSPHISFIYGWFSFLITSPVMIASLAIFLGTQMRIIAPDLPDIYIKGIAIFFVALFTFANCKGINVASGVQNIVLAIQILLILILVLAALLFLNKAPALPDAGSSLPQHAKSGLLALVSILWSFEGFNTLNFIIPEVRDGQQKIRKLIFAGCLVVFVIYFLINYCTLRFIPHAVLLKTPNVAVTLSDLLWGWKGKYFVFSLALIGMITVTHTAIVIGPRVTKALSDDSLTFSFLNRLHPIHTSPNHALIIQFGFVVFYITIGSFETLMTCFIIINWLFYAFIVIGFLKARKLMNVKSRLPFRIHELLEAVIFLFLMLVLLVGQVYNDFLLSMAGFGIFIAGFISSFFFLKKA